MKIRVDLWLVHAGPPLITDSSRDWESPVSAIGWHLRDSIRSRSRDSDYDRKSAQLAARCTDCTDGSRSEVPVWNGGCQFLHRHSIRTLDRHAGNTAGVRSDASPQIFRPVPSAPNDQGLVRNPL